MRFTDHGAELIQRAFDQTAALDLVNHLNELPAGAAGTRNLLCHGWCEELLARLRGHPKVVALLPANHAAVQCTLFEKSVDRNWLVPLHQDLSIPVASRVSGKHLNGWSKKEGVWYVQAPLDVLAHLVALRIHVDPCPEDAGPLRVVPGSHHLGRIAEADAAKVRDQFGERTVTAQVGDVLAISPLVLHASSKATGSSRRRVIHVLFGPRDLPLGLQWANEHA
jgi:hypothetical protein